jgi:DUF971 family protein
MFNIDFRFPDGGGTVGRVGKRAIIAGSKIHFFVMMELVSLSDLTAAQKHPTNIEVDLKQSQVRITWGDGAQSVYPLEYLRKICPCAACNEQRNNADPLRILKPNQALASGKLDLNHPAEMVGNYALQFFWEDGHRTGIYSFEFLRRATPA